MGRLSTSAAPGTGFNHIWSPFHGTQDRFLELNETIETLQFDAISGDIPNRDLLQADINLHGLTYLQQIQMPIADPDVHVLGPKGEPAGIHIEPGIWINILAITHPPDPTTVSRLATPRTGLHSLRRAAPSPRQSCANLCAGQYHTIQHTIVAAAKISHALRIPRPSL